MTALSEYVSGLSIDKDMSIRRLAELTGISVEAARRLVRGDGKPSDATLERVAAKLPGASLRHMRELAGRPTSIPAHRKVPDELNLLTDEEWATVVRVGRQILRSSGRLDQTFDRSSSDGTVDVTQI